LHYPIAHEIGHSLDPRRCYQIGLSAKEQLKIMEKWIKVRAEESPFTLYGQRSSAEDWAESMAFFLINPHYLKELAPRRYDFCLSMFEKKFSDWESKSKEIYKNWWNFIKIFDELEKWDEAAKEGMTEED
jgi:hypothetical protein